MFLSYMVECSKNPLFHVTSAAIFVYPIRLVDDILHIKFDVKSNDEYTASLENRLWPFVFHLDVSMMEYESTFFG